MTDSEMRFEAAKTFANTFLSAMLHDPASLRQINDPGKEQTFYLNASMRAVVLTDALLSELSK